MKRLQTYRDHELRQALSALAAALLLTACGSEADGPMPGPDLPVTPAEEQVPVRFGISERANTRADGTYYVSGKEGHKSIPEGSKTVGVFGYYQGTDLWETVRHSVSADFFYNQPMDSSAPNESNTTNLEYSPLRFWPTGEDDKLAFYAYYPFVEDATAEAALGIKLGDFASGQGSFVVTTKDKASEQIDFMVSDVEADQERKPHIPSATSDGRVGMTFYHKLARVLINIEINPHSHYDKVTSLKIVGVHKTATFWPEYMHERRAWEIPLTGAALRNVGEVVVDKLPATGSLTATDETALLLIPQRCEFEQHKIEFTLHNTTTDAEDTFTVSLTDLWRAGRDYEYNFSVDDENEVTDTTVFHGNAGIPANGGDITGEAKAE